VSEPGINDAAPSPPPTIAYNNLQNNTYYNLHLGRGLDNNGNPNNINTPSNWWGTSPLVLIDQTIHDFKDDFNLGIVTFEPFLHALSNQVEPNVNPIKIPTTMLKPTPTAVSTLTPVISATGLQS
jgi:hypothetical protein